MGLSPPHTESMALNSAGSLSLGARLVDINRTPLIEPWIVRLPRSGVSGRPSGLSRCCVVSERTELVP